MPKVKEILKKVRNIEINTKRLVDGLVYGEYASVFRGTGMDFSEVREYSAGDDIRNIDWKVTARMGKPYVKEFVEERDLRIYFLFDISRSGEFGNMTAKREKAAELAATIMLSAVRNNDNFGLVMFSDKAEGFIPARKGKKHMLKVIREMIYKESTGEGTDISMALRWAHNAIKRRSVMIIISDLITEKDYMKELKLIRGKHDVIVARIFDKNEENIPDIGYVYLEDEETGEQILVNTSDPEFIEMYRKYESEEEKRIKTNMLKCRIDLISLNTDEEIIVPLKKFFKERKKRMIR